MLLESKLKGFDGQAVFSEFRAVQLKIWIKQRDPIKEEELLRTVSWSLSLPVCLFSLFSFAFWFFQIVVVVFFFEEYKTKEAMYRDERWTMTFAKNRVKRKDCCRTCRVDSNPSMTCKWSIDWGKLLSSVRDMSRNVCNNKNGRKEKMSVNLANMAKMIILPQSPTRQSTKQ